jgi:alpha-1,2-glucosyltransferase
MVNAHSSGDYPAAIVLSIALLSGVWYSVVADRVPNPYLVCPSPSSCTSAAIILSESNFAQDEVFHVRQAQVYCSGDFHTWDPKITTPPGL